MCKEEHIGLIIDKMIFVEAIRIISVSSFCSTCVVGKCFSRAARMESVAMVDDVWQTNNDCKFEVALDMHPSVAKEHFVQSEVI